jgi:hypothetical protein
MLVTHHRTHPDTHLTNRFTYPASMARLVRPFGLFSTRHFPFNTGGFGDPFGSRVRCTSGIQGESATPAPTDCSTSFGSTLCGHASGVVSSLLVQAGLSKLTIRSFILTVWFTPGVFNVVPLQAASRHLCPLLSGSLTFCPRRFLTFCLHLSFTPKVLHLGLGS